MKISIVGMPKTGTTALYESIKNELPETTLTSFEPKTAEELDFIINNKAPFSLTKIMFGKLLDLEFNVSKFDKTIVIVRDPRDYLVSSLLYKFDNPNVSKDKNKYSELLTLFERKQLSPKQVSFTDLYQAFGQGSDEHWVKHLKIYFELIDFIKSQDVYVLKYEDFSENRLDELNNYLGLNVRNERNLKGWTSKIQRKGVSGDWKNWFTDKDLYLREIFKDVMDSLGYSDWELSQNPVIEKEFSTDYIKKLAEANLVDPTKAQEISPEYIDNLYSAATDNKIIAITRLALLKMEGKHIDKDILGALLLFMKASEMGSVRAHREVGKLILENCSDNMRALKHGADYYFKLAVDDNDPESCYFLGQIYLEGKLVEKSEENAFEMFLKGAELGSKSCMRKISACYQKGIGTDVDTTKAKYWMDLRGK